MAARQPSYTRAPPDERRQSLLEATARCLADKGAAGVSVRTICAEAGVSPGLLRHYFAGVSEAIAETYRWLGGQVSTALALAVDEAGADARARLLAYVTASFRPPIASPEMLADYVAFWSLTRADPTIAAVRTEIYGAFHEGLRALIAEYRPGMSDTRLPAVALTALIDGLWLEISLGDAPFSRDEAEQLAGKWLDALLG